MAVKKQIITSLFASMLGFFIPTFHAAIGSATIYYPSVGPVPPGITFTDIFESSGTDPVPLYGPPTGFSVGLDFSPVTFVSSTGGSGVDITDGQLNFTLVAAANNLGYVSINTINLFEGGDFTLVGAGTATTQTFASAILRASVTQINGVDVAPVSLTPVSSTVGYNLTANPGAGQLWSLGSSMNVAAQMASLFGPNQHATKINVAVDNQLITIGEIATVSFIAKKEFVVFVNSSTVVVPEPSSAFIAATAFVAMGAAVRRKRVKA